MSTNKSNLAEAETPENESMDAGMQKIEDKIIATLSVYPEISPSMLQMGIGPSIPSAIWRPIFNMMLRDGKIREFERQGKSALGTSKSFTVISLPKGDTTSASTANDR